MNLVNKKTGTKIIALFWALTMCQSAIAGMCDLPSDATSAALELKVVGFDISTVTVAGQPVDIVTAHGNTSVVNFSPLRTFPVDIKFKLSSSSTKSAACLDNIRQGMTTNMMFVIKEPIVSSVEIVTQAANPDVYPHPAICVYTIGSAASPQIPSSCGLQKGSSTSNSAPIPAGNDSAL